LLKYLEIGENCGIVHGAVSALSRCRALNHLNVDWQDGLGVALHALWRKLISLELGWADAESIDLVIEYCPNLQYLVFRTRFVRECGIEVNSEMMKHCVHKVRRRYPFD
jgi:hypothetical protein